MKNGDKPAFPISEEETDRIEAGIDIFGAARKPKPTSQVEMDIDN